MRGSRSNLARMTRLAFMPAMAKNGEGAPFRPRISKPCRRLARIFPSSLAANLICRLEARGALTEEQHGQHDKFQARDPETNGGANGRRSRNDQGPERGRAP